MNDQQIKACKAFLNFLFGKAATLATASGMPVPLKTIATFPETTANVSYFKSDFNNYYTNINDSLGKDIQVTKIVAINSIYQLLFKIDFLLTNYELLKTTNSESDLDQLILLQLQVYLAVYMNSISIKQKKPSLTVHQFHTKGEDPLNLYKKLEKFIEVYESPVDKDESHGDNESENEDQDDEDAPLASQKTKPSWAKHPKTEMPDNILAHPHAVARANNTAGAMHQALFFGSVPPGSKPAPNGYTLLQQQPINTNQTSVELSNLLDDDEENGDSNQEQQSAGCCPWLTKLFRCGS